MKKENWALGRGQMRSIAYELRGGMMQVNKGLTKDKQGKASSLYKKFIRDVEDIDFAMKNKDKEAALAAVEMASKSLSNWKAFVKA